MCSEWIVSAVNANHMLCTCRGDPSSLAADPETNFNWLFPYRNQKHIKLALFGPTPTIKIFTGYKSVLLLNVIT